MTRTNAAPAAEELPDGTVDAVVIGGGAAGLNGALMLARSRRSVVVIDSGAPRNAPAAGVHGLLALDGTPPAELGAGPGDRRVDRRRRGRRHPRQVPVGRAGGRGEPALAVRRAVASPSSPSS